MWSVKSLRRKIVKIITKKGVPDYIVRFETRGKEFICVARLTQAAVAKAKPAQHARQVGMKVPKSRG